MADFVEPFSDMLFFLSEIPSLLERRADISLRSGSLEA